MQLVVSLLILLPAPVNHTLLVNHQTVGLNVKLIQIALFNRLVAKTNVWILAKDYAGKTQSVMFGYTNHTVNVQKDLTVIHLKIVS